MFRLLSDNPGAVSIHAPREGGDGWSAETGSGKGCFNPRPPRGRRHARQSLYEAIAVFQSTPPAREATNAWRDRARFIEFQSTPPAREATRSKGKSTNAGKCFNPRPPRGRRPQSTQSKTSPSSCFNPRPPRGRRLPAASGRVITQSVSIHAPREGGDGERVYGVLAQKLFQSTPPAREATDNFQGIQGRHPFQSTPPAREATGSAIDWEVAGYVSIHAPREGGDPPCRNSMFRRCCFNPRPPRGRRH